MNYSAKQIIDIVAWREIYLLMRNKGIIVTIAASLLVVLGVIGGMSWYNKHNDSSAEVVVVGVSETTFAGIPDLHISTAASRDDAEQQVRDGKDAAIVATDSGYDLISEGIADPSVTAAVELAVNNAAHAEALQRVGVDTQAYIAALTPATVTTVNIAKQGNKTAMTTIMFGTVMMLSFIMMFAANVGSRITEEKSSRVVEIILSTARPLDFLAGKLLGSTIVGTIGTLITVTAGLIAVRMSGLLGDSVISYGLILLLIIGFILGMLFFGGLYAAAGSMVSRTEDLQSTQSPIMMLLLATVYIPAFGFMSTDTLIMQVLAWVPPFSLGAAPMEYAAGAFNLPMLIGSYTLLAASVLVVLRVAAYIYRRSILHNGSKLGWRQVLKKS